MFTWDLRLQPGIHRFEKHLNCVLPDYKMGETYKGKTFKVTVSYMNCLSGIIIGDGKKYGCLLNKDWLASEMVA